MDAILSVVVAATLLQQGKGLSDQPRGLGTIRGRVMVAEGVERLPEREHPSWYSLGPATRPDGIRSVVSASGLVKTCLVYLDVEGAGDAPAEPAVITADRGEFVPRLLVVRQGQMLRFQSREKQLVNFHVIPRFNWEVNTTLSKPGVKDVHRFERPEVAFPAKDQMSDSRLAWIAVLPHPFHDVTEEDGRFEITGVRPGLHRLSSWHELLDTPEALVIVSPGEVSEVDIVIGGPDRPVELPARASVPGVPLSGMLLVPRGWSLGRLGLTLHLTDPAPGTSENQQTLELSQDQSSATPECTFRFNAGQVVPGRYLIELRELPLQWKVDAGQSGATDVTLRIGEPASAHVRVVDEESGKAVKLERLSWTRIGTDGEAAPSKLAEWDPSLVGYHLRAPVGTVQIVISDPAYHLSSGLLWQDVDLQAGGNDIEVRVRPPSGVAVSLRDGDRTLRWEGVHVEVLNWSGSHVIEARTQEESHRKVIYLTPGRYTIVVHDRVSQEVIGRFKVEVPKGEVVERAVEVKRRH